MDSTQTWLQKFRRDEPLCAWLEGQNAHVGKSNLLLQITEGRGEMQLKKNSHIQMVTMDTRHAKYKAKKKHLNQRRQLCPICLLCICLIRWISFHFYIMFTEMLHLFRAKLSLNIFILQMYAPTSKEKQFSPHKTSVSSNHSYIMCSNGIIMSMTI